MLSKSQDAQTLRVAAANPFLAVKNRLSLRALLDAPEILRRLHRAQG